MCFLLLVWTWVGWKKIYNHGMKKVRQRSEKDTILVPQGPPTNIHKWLGVVFVLNQYMLPLCHNIIYHVHVTQGQMHSFFSWSSQMKFSLEGKNFSTPFNTTRRNHDLQHNRSQKILIYLKLIPQWYRRSHKYLSPL